MGDTLEQHGPVEKSRPPASIDESASRAVATSLSDDGQPGSARPSASLWQGVVLANRATSRGLKMQAKGRERGLALLMAMVVTAILGALSVQFSYNLRANLYMSGNLEAATQAYFNARSATKIALLAVNAKQNFPQMQQFMSLMGQGASTRLEIWQRACDFVNIFATGKADLAPAADKALAEIVAGVKAGKKAVISGFVDSTGNAEQNAELAKLRALAVREQLKALGVTEDQVELKKPGNIDAGASAEARRVEVSLG